MPKQRFKGQHARVIDKWLREQFHMGRVIVLEKVPDMVVYAIIIDDAAFDGESPESRDAFVQKVLREEGGPTSHELGSLVHIATMTTAELRSLRDLILFMDSRQMDFAKITTLASHVAGIESWRKKFRHDV